MCCRYGSPWTRQRFKTAGITISDWAGESDPNGSIGQELSFNFVEIEPYLMDSADDLLDAE
jgi:hypothetical protein